MDMSLLSRGDIRTLGRPSAHVDYCVFVATVQAMQLATATARAETRCGGQGGEDVPRQQMPLTEILLGSQDWQDAVLSQGGSFNPAFARGMETL